MKPLLLLAVFAAGLSNLHAQVVPTTPKTFGKRNIGDALDNHGTGLGLGSVSGANPPKAPPPEIRHITYFSIGQPRQWKAADGRVTIGTLAAFEEAEGKPDSKDIVAPEKPTIVQEGNIRLLVRGKAFTIALANLSEEDQAYVKSMEEARDNAPPKTPAAEKPADP